MLRSLPSSLQTLLFGGLFNQDLRQVQWPPSLETLNFEDARHKLKNIWLRDLRGMLFLRFHLSIYFCCICLKQDKYIQIHEIQHYFFISFDYFHSNSFASAALLLAWNKVAQLLAGQIPLLVVLVSGMNKRYESTIIYWGTCPDNNCHCWWYLTAIKRVYLGMLVYSASYISPEDSRWAYLVIQISSQKAIVSAMPCHHVLPRKAFATVWLELTFLVAFKV